jgi:hypothetical protein
MLRACAASIQADNECLEHENFNQFRAEGAIPCATIWGTVDIFD